MPIWQRRLEMALVVISLYEGNALMNAVRYALIDGAIEERLLAFLEKENPPHCCLYSEPIQPDLVALAPYLVEMTPAVEDWLQKKQTPWGIYLITSADMNKLRQHLRKYLQVLIPGQSKPVLFRFYDPRNIWDLLSVLSDWEKNLFIGPTDIIITHWNNISKEVNFRDLKKKYPEESRIRSKIMQISQTQMDSITIIYEQRYIEEIAKKIKSWEIKHHQIDKLTIKEMLHWLKKQNITDDRSIRCLFYLFYRQEFFSVNSIPQRYKDILCIENEEGVFKAETLLLQELGKIPL